MQVCIHDTEIRRLTEMPSIKLYVNLRKYDGYRKWAALLIPLFLWWYFTSIALCNNQIKHKGLTCTCPAPSAWYTCIYSLLFNTCICPGLTCTCPAPSAWYTCIYSLLFNTCICPGLTCTCPAPSAWYRRGFPGWCPSPGTPRASPWPPPGPAGCPRTSRSGCSWRGSTRTRTCTSACAGTRTKCQPPSAGTEPAQQGHSL